MADRRSVRFQPDPMAVAQVDFKVSKDFKPTLVGIVLNESYTGCALVVASDEILKKGRKLKVKVGALSALKGEIAWVKTLEENIQKIGIKLLE